MIASIRSSAAAEREHQRAGDRDREREHDGADQPADHGREEGAAERASGLAAARHGEAFDRGRAGGGGGRRAEQDRGRWCRTCRPRRSAPSSMARPESGSSLSTNGSRIDTAPMPPSPGSMPMMPPASRPTSSISMRNGSASAISAEPAASHIASGSRSRAAPCRYGAQSFTLYFLREQVAQIARDLGLCRERRLDLGLDGLAGLQRVAAGDLFALGLEIRVGIDLGRGDGEGVDRFLRRAWPASSR